MPKIVDHDKCREELLTRCLKLFSQKGYNNVTIKEIIRELKISTGMLYHYFPSKKILFESLFKHRQEQDMEKFSQIIGNADQDKISEIFMDHWVENEKSYQDLEMLALDFFRSNKCKPNEEVFIQYNSFYRDAISSCFGIPTKIGLFILIFLYGLSGSTLLAPGQVNIEEQLALLKKIVIDPSTNQQKRTRRRS